MSSLLDNLLIFSTQPYPVINILETDKLLPLPLSKINPQLTPETVTNTEPFSLFINQTLESAGCTYGIGGYNELRNLYARSNVFNGDEPRRLQLGVDVWGPVFSIKIFCRSIIDYYYWYNSRYSRQSDKTSGCQYLQNIEACSCFYICEFKSKEA